MLIRSLLLTVLSCFFLFPSLRGQEDLRLASLEAYRSGDLDRAYALGVEAVEAWEALDPKRDTFPRAKACKSLAFYAQRKRQYRYAEELYRRALGGFERLEEPLEAYKTSKNLHRLLMQTGDFERAVGVATRMVELARNMEDWQRGADALNALGLTHVEVGRMGRAKSALAAAHARNVALRREEAAAMNLHNLSNAHFYSGDYEAALAAGRRAVRKFEKWEWQEEAVTTLNTVALAQNALGRFTESQQTLERAYNNATKLGEPVLVALVHGNEFEWARTQGRWSDAHGAARAALLQLLPKWTPTEERPLPHRTLLDDSPDAQDLFVYLGDYAESMAKTNRAGLALEAYRLADYVADLIRAGQGGEVSRLFWRGKAYPLYQRAFDLAVAEGRTADAFFFLEKSRAVLLLEQLLTAGAQTERATVTENELLPLDSFQLLLVETGVAASLQYFYGQEALFAMWVTPNDARIERLSPSTDVNRDLARLKPLLRQPVLSRAGANRRDSLLVVLYELLIPDDLPSGSPLLVQPTLALEALPFAALRHADRYLIEDHPLLYAESASVFHRQTRAAPATAPPQLQLLAVAPFASPPADGRPFLPASAEAITYTQAYDGQVLADAEATTATFLHALATLNERPLHLATHAYADTSDVDRSAIELYDDRLTVDRLYGQRIRSGLVNLSACQTRVGRAVAGEGVMSLARAFTAAGARGVIASQWSIDDRATARLEEATYAALAEGATKAEALRAAQLAYLADQNLPDNLKVPYYWAGLGYWGDNGTVVEPSSGWYWWGGALLLISVVVFANFSFGRR